MECCNNTTSSGQDTLQCSVCKGKYHCECLNMTTGQSKNLSRQYKAAWKCPSCTNVTRRARSNINTPVRCYTELPPDDRAAMDTSCDIIDQDLCPSRGLDTGRSDNSLPSMGSIDYKMLFTNLETTLSQLRKDINNDMRQMHGEVQSTLASIQKEIQTIRMEQSGLKQEVSDIREDIVALQTSCQSHSVDHEVLKKRVDELQSPASVYPHTALSNLEIKIDTLEQQARQCNIEISNLPERRNENLSAIVEAIGHVLKSPVSLSNVVAVHRVPHAHHQTTRPKNIILKFASRLQRDNLLSAFRKAKSLKTDQVGITGTITSIYLNEHLTLRKKQLFRKTRETANNQNFKYVWVRNGTIMVRERDGSTAFAIRGESDLDKIKTQTKES